MTTIDLRTAKAVFFDRGNVTHECRVGPSEEHRDDQMARSLSACLTRACGREIPNDLLIDSLIRPWKATFSSRAILQRETPVTDVLEASLSALGLSLPRAALADLAEAMGSSYVQWDMLNPGVDTLFATLHDSGRQIAIVANTVVPDSVYIRQYKESGLDSYIDAYVLSYSLGFRKPDPRMIVSACQTLQIAPCECIMIGDKLEVDIRCARAAGARSVWFDSKHDSPPETLRPDYVVASFDELSRRIAI